MEYGNGPQALTARWEGRPETPDFQWGQDGVVLPSHDLWLQQLDLEEANLQTLVDTALLEQNPDAIAQNLDAVKALLIQHAGSLQACFFAYECQVTHTCFRGPCELSALLHAVYLDYTWFADRQGSAPDKSNEHGTIQVFMLYSTRSLCEVFLGPHRRASQSSTGNSSSRISWYHDFQRFLDGLGACSTQQICSSCTDIHPSIRYCINMLMRMQQTASLTIMFYHAETRPFGTLTFGRQAG